jgi:hypothetical protein
MNTKAFPLTVSVFNQEFGFFVLRKDGLRYKNVAKISTYKELIDYIARIFLS